MHDLAKSRTVERSVTTSQKKMPSKQPIRWQPVKQVVKHSPRQLGKL